MSTDPWVDFVAAYGLDALPSPAPPDIIQIYDPEGFGADPDEEGNVVYPPPLPPLPPGAPECAQDYYDSVGALVAAALSDALRQNIPPTVVRARYEWPPPGSSDSYVPIRFVAAPLDPRFPPPNWGDPYASQIIPTPVDCPFLDDFFSGFGAPPNCDSPPLNLAFPPGIHRLISELVRPSGRSFIFRAPYDYIPGVGVISTDLLTQGDDAPCTAYILGLVAQYEAAMDVAISAFDSANPRNYVYIRAYPYDDGILTGVELEISGGTLSDPVISRIGVSTPLAIAFCETTKFGIFRDDIGYSSCSDGDDDMGCSCEEIRQIIANEIEEKLGVVIEAADWLSERREDIDRFLDDYNDIRNRYLSFFGPSDDDQSWEKFRIIFSRLREYMVSDGRGDVPDEDAIIIPSMLRRVMDGFALTRERLRAIASALNSTNTDVWYAVRVTVTGERRGERDLRFYPQSQDASAWPYNHYGQVRILYAASETDTVYSPWQWVRSRDQELLFRLPAYISEDRVTGQPTRRPAVFAEWQAYPGISMVCEVVERPNGRIIPTTGPVWDGDLIDTNNDVS